LRPYEPLRLPLKNIDWAGLVPLIGEANAALARYDGMLQSMVNPVILLSPLATQEAVLSSRIEGTQASLEEVLKYEADLKEGMGESKQVDIHEILNYRKAMGAAVKDLKKYPLHLNLIKKLHEILLDSVRGKNKSPGQFRRTQNFIGPPGCNMETATFVPPSPEKVLPAMDNWEKYLHHEEKDRLAQLAVVKAQFEMIHPFLDGNGRVGRMLLPLFLFEKGILSSPMFYLSEYFEKHRDIYYAKLQGISRNDNWNSWIEFFLTAVIEQSKINTEKARAIFGLYNQMKLKVVELTHSQFSPQTVDALFFRPIFTPPDFIKRAKIPKQTAMIILRQLKGKIIRELQKARGRRPAVYVFSELVNITEGRKTF
jgi:Fic family protein